MSIDLQPRQWRGWIPVPDENGDIRLIRWVLLDADRLALSGALLAVVFLTFMGVATLWTFEMQRLLTETETVQTILNTFLSGMILLVSIVVSINSIVLSHDITSVEKQDERIRGMVNFRQDLGELSEPGEDPSDLSSFLEVMSRVIGERAQALTADLDGFEEESADQIREHATSVSEAAKRLGAVDEASGAEFAVLWKGIDFGYGPYIEQSRSLGAGHSTSGSFEDLIEAFELFAIGKEYFKTLYYTREVSKLSQTLLVVALPAILFNASTILAINGQVLPDGWILGLPPLQTFVAVSFTISIAPYLVLTSYMLRLSTVARITSAGGVFSLK